MPRVQSWPSLLRRDVVAGACVRVVYAASFAGHVERQARERTVRAGVLRRLPRSPQRSTFAGLLGHGSRSS
eukprot:4900352-Lingulodinium_polyedra.AAC.1